MQQNKTPTVSIVPTDLSAYISAPASIIIAGAAATGKSMSVAEVTPNCLWITSTRKALRAYASRLLDAQKQARDLEAAGQPIPADIQRDIQLRLPKKVIEIPEFVTGTNGEDVRNPNLPAIKAVLAEYLRLLKDDPKAFSGVVFDEWSRFAQRLQEEYKVESNGDIWAANRKLHSMHRYLAKALPEASQKSMVLICEWREPEFHQNGELKSPGGPSLPTMNMTRPLSYEMDFVFEYGLKEEKSRDPLNPAPPKVIRYWSTEAHPYYARKSRDTRIPIYSTSGLNELLARADIYL